MSVSEQNTLIRAKDAAGGSYILYPITKAENIDGLDELIDKTQPADYIINATYDMATVDKTYDDIVAAYNAGSNLVLYHDSEKFDFVAGGPGEFIFEKINVGLSNGVTVARASIYGQDNYLYREEYKKYNSSEIQTALDSKADSDHNHDSSYDALGAATAAETSAKTYADSIGTTTLTEAKTYTDASLAGVTTSGDGAAYTATVSGITSLTAGASFTMIPHVDSTSTAPTLDVNGLGAKNIRRRISTATKSTAVGYAAAWLSSGKPIRVTYDGTYWIADLPKPSASDISGTLPIANGGTGATTAAAALTNLGAAPAGLISAIYTVASDAEIDTALNTELNKMSNDTARHIVLKVSTDGLSLLGGGNVVFLYKRTSSYVFARATRYGISTPRLSIRERSMRGGTWDDWYDPVYLDNDQYGSTLPSSGTAGQLFFKI